MGTAVMAVPKSDDSVQLLKKADSIKTSNHPEFLEVMKRLGAQAASLPPSQQMYLRYLQAWQIGYQGDYEVATPLLKSILAESEDATLRIRAGTTLVNMLTIGSHYEDAFSQMNELLDQLPQVTDRDARIQTLGVAALLSNEAGQYDLGLTYANQMLRENPTGGGSCKAKYYRIESMYESGKLQTIDSKFQDGIDSCIEAGEPLFADGIRYYMASFYLNQNRPSDTVKLLSQYYAEVRHIGYPWLTSSFDVLLARVHWKEGQDVIAKQYAGEAVNDNVKNQLTRPLIQAYDLLYRISKKQGDLASALDYHEKYMAADKGYLNEVGAKALAFQTVKQQVLAKKLQIDTLNKQNQILVLQQKLGKKAAETSRLYIVLLLGVLASIGLWSYRLKRSQLRFMKLARRDGLTGIFNRQHFVSEAELQLQYCKKSSRDASLILIDLDHFKMVNDTHGHAVGDRVLRRAVEACKAHLRSTDIFGRLGGEEFGILLPECTLEQTAARAEQIRAAIAEAATSDDAPQVAVSASFGVASSTYSGYELRQLLIHADEALYQAKRDGRNRVNVNDNQDACLKMG